MEFLNGNLMYFNLLLFSDEVDILYDDGVRFKAPISAVRRRVSYQAFVQQVLGGREC